MKRRIGLFCLTGLLVCTAWASANPIRVSCIGNSITYGTGLQHPETDSYPAQLQLLLGDKYEVGRFGKPGATLLRRAFRPYMQQQEFKDAMAFHGDIAVIHLGVNDTDPRAWPNYRDDFIGDYSALIDSVRKSNPKCRVIVARMTPLSDRHYRFLSGTRDWHDEIQQAIEQVAERNGCELISFYEPLHCRPELFPDAIHPNREGYGIMAQIVYSAITGDYGGLQLPPYFTDNMVLPRERPFSLQGVSDAGDRVVVRINGQKHTALTGIDGRWEVTVEPLPSGGPYTLSVKGKKQTIELHNVMAGELWLCSGQSNMTFQLQQCSTAADDIPLSDNPDIRLLNLEARWLTNNIQWSEGALDSINKLQYFTPAVWEVCSPQTSPRFSAIGYYFARELRDSLRCPIGVINNAIGGSGIEAWIDRTTVEYEFPAILRDWTRNDFIQDWVRGRAETNMGENHDALQRHPYQPCYLYEAGIAPLTSLPISGVVWYQGESNAHNKDAHDILFPLLVSSWRKAWSQPALPFYYVQLSSLNRPSWPWFRYSQYKLLSRVPHTGMAVSSDVGDSLDVHPRNKRPVGHRLAVWALHDCYGFSRIVPSGPLFRSVRFSDSSAWVSFDYSEGLHSSDGAPLRTFEVAEREGEFFPAEAVVVGNEVRVSSRKVPNPRFVRYGWQPFTRANLVNGAGLPASTFRNE
ncbi:MAG: sialate O-acetylesterase [Bacteroidaceae bacterium]|nr:sialate O-acetylesterase [Bacteroidaceae bacterium]